MQKIKNKTYKELALEFKNTGSKRAFNDLYIKIKPGLLNYINGIVKDKTTADEICSIVLSTVYSKIHQYNETYQITTWAYKIAFNECILRLRSSRKTLSINSFMDMGIELPFSSSFEAAETLKTEDDFIDEDFVFNEQLRLIKNEIDNLPSKYKRYIVERLLNNKSYNEILTMMLKIEPNISLQTVKNRIFRGKQIIKNNLSNDKVFESYLK